MVWGFAPPESPYAEPERTPEGTVTYCHHRCIKGVTMTGRFAPTPSGRMHIGNVYAMLGAWLSARKTGDSIRLRIEDIDEPRVVPNAAETMMHDLDWLGLN